MSVGLTEIIILTFNSLLGIWSQKIFWSFLLFFLIIMKHIQSDILTRIFGLVI